MIRARRARRGGNRWRWAGPMGYRHRHAVASPDQRARWELGGAGYGIHWPELDEDLSTEGLLRGARAPRGSASWRAAS